MNSLMCVLALLSTYPCPHCRQQTNCQCKYFFICFYLIFLKHCVIFIILLCSCHLSLHQHDDRADH